MKKKTKKQYPTGFPKAVWDWELYMELEKDRTKSAKRITKQKEKNKK